MICAKTAEPIEMPFGVWTRVGPRMRILYGGPDPHVKGQLLGERTCHSYLRTVRSNRLSCRISNFDSSQYSISMQSVKRYGITVQTWRHDMIISHVCIDIP